MRLGVRSRNVKDTRRESFGRGATGRNVRLEFLRQSADLTTSGHEKRLANTNPVGARPMSTVSPAHPALKESRTGPGRLKGPSASAQVTELRAAALEVHQPTPPPEKLPPGELRMRALLDAIADPVFTIRKDGTILAAHIPHDTPFTLSAENLIGKRVMELLPIQIGPQAVHYLEKALRTGQTQTVVCPYLVAGKSREFQARISRCAPDEVIAALRDVTTEKLAEKEIIEISNREQLRIGQDLHDGLGQHLTGVTFLSGALEKKLAARSLPEAEDAAEIGRLVLQALSQTRNLARGLFPVELESNELGPAFRELAATVEKLFHIVCVVESDDKLSVGDRVVANHLFRLAQEAINNSVKHGKARRVDLRLKSAEDRIVLCIRDNGVGFPPDMAQTKGLGLRIMAYRAQKIGATFEIGAGENGGAVVTCSLPHSLRKVEFSRR